MKDGKALVVHQKVSKGTIWLTNERRNTHERWNAGIKETNI